MEWTQFVESVDPKKCERVIIHKFTVPDAAHDMRLYTAHHYLLQCCVHLKTIYPNHHHYFFSSLPLSLYSSEFSSHWKCNYKHISPKSGALRGFCPEGPCVFIIDDFGTHEVRMSLAGFMMGRKDVILIILCFEDK